MAKPGAIKAVLIDFDGTLVRLRTDYESLRRDLVRALPRLDPSLKSSSILDMLWRLRKSAASPERRRVVASAYHLLDKYEWAARSAARVIPEGRELCVSIDQAGLAWAIVSNNSRRIIEDRLDVLGFPEPNEIVARGNRRAHKPDVSVGRLALERLGVSCEDALLVGDSNIDRQLGTSLGIETWIIPERPAAERRRAHRVLQRRLGLGRP